MEIEYKGGNCILLTAKKTKIAVDPKLSELGLKDQAEGLVAQLATQSQFAVPGQNMLKIDGPGEYEIENVSVKGIAALAHTDAKGEPLRATIYRIDTGEFSLVVVGHIHPDLSEEQLEQIGVVDLLVVPVGGNGYTLDATGAVQIVRAVDPKAVIPTHYAEKGTSYPVPQAELELFKKDLGAPIEELSKLKFKGGNLAEALTVYAIQSTS